MNQQINVKISVQYWVFSSNHYLDLGSWNLFFKPTSCFLVFQHPYIQTFPHWFSMGYEDVYIVWYLLCILLMSAALENLAQLEIQIRTNFNQR